MSSPYRSQDDGKFQLHVLEGNFLAGSAYHCSGRICRRKEEMHGQTSDDAQETASATISDVAAAQEKGKIV